MELILREHRSQRSSDRPACPRKALAAGIPCLGCPTTQLPQPPSPQDPEHPLSSVDADRSGGVAVHPRRAASLPSASGCWFGRAWSVPFLVLAAFFLFFFRDPDRHPPTGANLVVSPADARVMVAGELPWPGAPPGEWQDHQHVPVADGRPRQPDAGRRARSRGWSIIRASSCRRTRRRPAS